MLPTRRKVGSILDTSCYETVAVGHCRFRQWGEAVATLQQMEVRPTMTSYDLMIEALAHMSKKDKVRSKPYSMAI